MIATSGIRYAVKIECGDGRTWLAHNNDAGVMMFRRHGTAMRYKKELAKHLRNVKKLRIVKVFFRVEELE